MTPCGFYLLFCRDSVFLRVSAPLADVRAQGFVHVCNLREYSHVFKYVLAKVADAAFFCLTAAGCIAPRLPRLLSQSNATSHLLDAIVKNQRISHGFTFCPPFCLGAWIHFIIQPQHVYGRVFGVSVMVTYWMKWDAPGWMYRNERKSLGKTEGTTAIFVRTSLSLQPMEWGHFGKVRTFWPALTLWPPL